MSENKELIIQEILGKKCQNHEGYPLDLLYISDKPSEHQICYMCFQTKPIKKEEILNLRQIIFSQEESILQNYPPLSDQNLYKQLDKLFNEQIQIDQSISKIEQFFKEFEEKFLSIIKNIQNEMKDKIENLINLKRKFIDTYNEISSKMELKNILTNPCENRCQKIHEIIVSKFNDSQQNTRKIQELVDQFSKYKSSINFDGPVKIEESVIQLIQQIDFFSDFNAEKYTNVILGQELNDNHKYKILNVNSKTSTNIDILLDLINNQTNYCTKQSQKEIEQLLQKYSLLLNQVELKQPIYEEKKRNCFTSLNESQLESIRVLSQKILQVENMYNQEAESSLKMSRSSSTMSASSSLKHAQILNISPKIQPKSLEIYNSLFSCKGNQYQKIEGLLREYPIFELESISSGHQLLFFNMIKSSYADSQNLHIERLQNLNIKIEKINKKSHALCSSNCILEVDKKYILRLTIKSNPNTCNNLILFGLIPDQNKDIAYLRDSGLTYNERADSCFTLSRVIKGDPIPEINKVNIQKQIEVRIYLKRKIFEIATYPGYENVSELDNKSRIKDNINYRFSVELYQKDDQIIINEFMIVDSFDFDL